MSWDFSTDPEFQEQLDWMQDFVRREIWPLETIWRELGGYEGLREALSPLQEQVKDRNLWAAHLPPELGALALQPAQRPTQDPSARAIAGEAQAHGAQLADAA